MRKMISLMWVTSATLVIASSTVTFGQDMMVFTANQEFLSRIYTLEPDGSVVHIPEGPGYDPDVFYRDYLDRKRREGFQFLSNPIWGWDHHDRCQSTN